MPELPEAERARQTLESVLGRRVAAVDDTDTYVCRPHQPGEIAAALAGHEFVSAHRRGKFLWMETEDGPALGLHLGMAGSIALEAPDEKPLWDRFTVEFDDGTRFALRDRRRLGRAILNPDFSHVGPDAAEVDRDTFRARFGRSAAPVKARLLDQGVISGVGNLLADEILWQARMSPRRPANDLSDGRPRRAAAGDPTVDARRDPQGRRAHRPPDRPSRARWALPARRRRARAGDDRRPDDVLVPGLPGLS